jgi:threonine dehydratase
MAADALIEATGGGGLAGPVTAAVVGVAAAIAFVRVERHRGRSPDRESWPGRVGALTAPESHFAAASVIVVAR